MPREGPPPSGEDRGHRARLHRRGRSFGYAFAGIRYALGEPNFRIQLAIGALALIAAGVLHVRPSDWLDIILVSLAVLLMEMLNTAIEAVVDLISPEYHPLARIAKDVTAGAVLLAAFGAVVVGLYIFIPPLAHLLGFP